MVSQTCVVKTIQGNNTQQVKMGGVFRLIMYGGAKKSSDNNAFYFAAQNVQKDYRNDMCIYSVLISNGAKQIVEYLKNQTDNTVQSLDIFCHGGTSGLYMRMNSSLSENSDDAKTSNLYQSVLAMNLGYAGLGF
ncbi:MAG: hypothetical protein Q4D68_04240, partial [Moraxella equi]|nr:hypothetical protein [Moraxella equi]